MKGERDEDEDEDECGVERRLSLVGSGRSLIRMIAMIFRCLWGWGFDCLVGLGEGLAL